MSDLKKQFHGLRTLIDHQFELENNLIHKHEELAATATRLRGLVVAVNKYKKSRLITDRKAMFELAKELKDD